MCVRRAEVSATGESYERIKMRSRECESSLPLDYLRKLSRAYEDFLEDISQIIPVLRVNWSEFHSAEDMAVQIQEQYKAMRSIKRVDWDGAASPGVSAFAPRPLATPLLALPPPSASRDPADPFLFFRGLLSPSSQVSSSS